MLSSPKNSLMEQTQQVEQASTSSEAWRGRLNEVAKNIAVAPFSGGVAAMEEYSLSNDVQSAWQQGVEITVAFTTMSVVQDGIFSFLKARWGSSFLINVAEVVLTSIFATASMYVARICMESTNSSKEDLQEMAISTAILIASLSARKITGHITRESGNSELYETCTDLLVNHYGSEIPGIAKGVFKIKSEALENTSTSGAVWAPAIVFQTMGTKLLSYFCSKNKQKTGSENHDFNETSPLLTN